MQINNVLMLLPFIDGAQFDKAMLFKEYSIVSGLGTSSFAAALFELKALGIIKKSAKRTFKINKSAFTQYIQNSKEFNDVKHHNIDSYFSYLPATWWKKCGKTLKEQLI